jgi:hypothetical protein
MNANDKPFACFHVLLTIIEGGWAILSWQEGIAVCGKAHCVVIPFTENVLGEPRPAAG